MDKGKKMISIFSDINSLANIAILFFLLITAIAVVLSRNLLTSTILLSVFSMLMATEYLILGAPDVAITEAAVGAGISTILILLALFLVGEKEKKINGKKLLPFILMVSVAAVLIYASTQLPPFGATIAPAQSHVAEYYVHNSINDTGVPNVVASILASYRGYDTFGETVVIFTAAIAVMMLLGKFSFKRKRN